MFELSRKQSKLLKSFLLGFLVSAAILTVFVATAPLFKVQFMMGFPALLIEQQGRVIHVSWLIPLIVGIVFFIAEGISML